MSVERTIDELCEAFSRLSLRDTVVFTVTFLNVPKRYKRKLPGCPCGPKLKLIRVSTKELPNLWEVCEYDEGSGSY